MRETTLTELRKQTERYFDLVEAGEVIRLLRNGRPIAEIHPIPVALPSWKQRKARAMKLSGVAISKLILEERGDH